MEINKKIPIEKRIEELIEKYRFWIGGGLLILILIGSGILLWRENYSKPKLEDRIAGLEEKVDDLQNQISKSEFLISNQNSNAQISNDQTGTQGQVAGANSAQDPSTSVGMTKSGAQPINGKVNLNTATVAELDSLPGIGPVYAQRIIDYRNANGGFKNIDEVKNVKGIGDKTFDKFKELISVN